MSADRWPDDLAREHARVADGDAAYVLGALEPGDRRAFERHLAACDRCRSAVADLAGMPGLLALVPPDQALADEPGDGAGDEAREDAGDGHERAAGGGAGPVDRPARLSGPTGDVVDLAAVAGRIRRDRTRRRWAAAAVAASLLLVGGGAGWALSDARAPAASVHAGTGATVALGAVGGSGVTARVALDTLEWGTRLTWSCGYADAATAPYPSTYALVVVAADGTATTVATWAATGTGAQELTASTHLAVHEVRRVEIRSGSVVLARGEA